METLLNPTDSDRAHSDTPEESQGGVISAYAAALRLLQLIESVKAHHKYRLLEVDAEQIRGFEDKVHSWLESMEKLPSKVYGDLDAQAERFVDRAFDVCNIIDYYVVEQKSGAYRHRSDSAVSSLYKDLVVVIQEMDLIIQEMSSAVAECTSFTNTSKEVDPHPTTEPKIQQRITPVGIEHQLRSIKEELRNGVKDRQVVAIVGMGGIGKTTLARSIYEECETWCHFDRQYMVTVSQEYDVTRILQEILGEKSIANITYLGNKLHQELIKRRYLVVLDDLWSMEAWDELVIYLPEDSNGSRIIVTTRNSKIADALCPRFFHQMNLLNGKESWELLCQIVAFDMESCPSELQEIGRHIARNCKGLPISILTIGGLLSKSDMTVDYWSYVAKNVMSLASLEDDERCRKMLRLSYDNMPIHLKLLFLDFARFYEDQAIYGDNLMGHWVIYGLVKPQPGNRIEEVALDYLMDLVGRNMIFVRSLDEIGKINTLGVHDLLFDLCRRESSNEHIYGSNLLTAALSRCASCSLLKIDRLECDGFKERPCLGRIFHQLRDIVTKYFYRASKKQCVSKGRAPQFCTPSPSLSNCEIEYPHYHGLALDIIPATSPNEIRYCIPMSLIWNSQCCEDSDKVLENWEMPQLKISSYGPRGKSGVIFEQLISIRFLDGRGMKEVTSVAACPFPNLKRLSIACELDSVAAGPFPNLKRLSIACELDLGQFSLPHSLMDLRLRMIYFCDRHTKAIMQLPNLEILRLDRCEFENPKWCSVSEGQFRKLKKLEIVRGLSIKYLHVEQDQFPGLQYLKLFDPGEVTLRISPVISHISTLVLIELEECKDSVVESAEKILKQQRRWGNESFYVKVDNLDKSYLLEVDDEDDDWSDEEEDYIGDEIGN